MISDLLNVEISSGDGVVTLQQSAYIQKLVDTYVPDGVPSSFTATDVPASA